MKILISGHNGKLGSRIKNTLHKTHTIIGHNRHECLDEKMIHFKPCCIIDVTSSLSIQQHIKIYLKHQIPIIIGSSGISPKKAREIKELAHFPLLIVPNFSTQFQSFAQQVIEIHKSYPITKIIETHHQSKIDSPSGSALYLSSVLDHCPIESHRVPKYIAQHTVEYTVNQKKQYLTHTISSPEEFIEGVMAALISLKKHQNGQIVFPGY